MPKMHLTKAALDRISPGPKEVVYWDASLAGFGVKVTPKGRKVFIVLYRTRDGRSKLRKYTIGPYGQTTLAGARLVAQKVLAARLDGRDPAAEKRRERHKFIKDTIDDVVSDYIERHVDRMRTSAGIRRNLHREVLSRWSGRSIHEIGKHDILKMLDQIVDRGAPATANQVFSVVRAMFNWCIGRGLLEKSPCAGLSKPTPEKSRDRVLTDEEIAAVLIAARHMGYPYGRIVELLLLTGQRREEVAGLRWSELDLPRAIWTLPGHRTKNGRPHIVHLAPAAIECLMAIPRSGELLFGNGAGKPFNDFSGHKLELDKASGVTGWVLHDLRRTVVSGMAETGGSPSCRRQDTQPPERHDLGCRRRLPAPRVSCRAKTSANRLG